MNRKMLESQVKDLQLMERDLLRDLSEVESEYVINKGYKTFFEDCLNWDDEDYKYWRLMTTMLSTYYTRTESDWLNLMCDVTDSEKHHVADRLEKVASELRKYNSMNPDIIPGDEGEADEDGSLYKFEHIFNLIDTCYKALTKEFYQWQSLYEELDVNRVELIATAIEYDESERVFTFEELTDAFAQKIMDYVVKYYSEYLINHKGETIILPQEVLGCVADNLFKSEDNLKIKIVNSQITVM